MRGEERETALRTISRFRCSTCGATQEFVLHRQDLVDHTCGRHGWGGTWWVHRGPGR